MRLFWFLARLTALIFVLNCTSASARPKAVFSTTPHKANFTLSDPEKLFASVFGKQLAKSEFETAAQWQARLNGIRPPGTYYLMLGPTNVRYVYSAEIQRLVVMARQTANLITVSFSSQDLGKAPMQNAFGATVDTTLIKTRSLELEVQNLPKTLPKEVLWQAPSDIGSSFFQDVGLGLPVTIAPPDAERVVKNKAFGLVLGFTIGDLTQARRQKGGVAPTFDSPIGLGGWSSYLPVNVAFLAVLDRNTKTVVVSWTNPRA